MPNSTTDLLMDNFRARCPGATDDVIELEFYNTVIEVSREAFDILDPVTYTPDADPATWLSSTLWPEAYQTILEGTLARLFAQPNKPWANPQLAEVHLKRYISAFNLLRTEKAWDTGAISSNIYAVQQEIRSAVPMARAQHVNQALFSVVTDLYRDVLTTTRPYPDTPISGWLTGPEWLEYHQLLVDGTIANLFMQAGQVWSNPQLAAPYAARYAEGLARARSESAWDLAVNAGTTLAGILQAIRSVVPKARIDHVYQAMHGVVDELYQEVITGTPPLPNVAPSSWLTSDQFIEHKQLLTDGTIARLLMQAGQPWSNPELAAPYAARHTELFARARTEAGWATAVAAGTSLGAILQAVRSTVPKVRVEHVYQELYSTVEELCREVLASTPPLPSAAPSAWLTADQYKQHYQMLVDGTVANLFMQAGQSWTNPELAAPYAARYAENLARARTEAGWATAVTAGTSLGAILQAVRSNVPKVRVEHVYQELYNTIEELCREVLNTTPPLPSVAPSSWLTADEYKKHYQTLVEGTTYRLFSQFGQPHFSAELAAAHSQKYQVYVSQSRAEAAGATATSSDYARVYSLVRQKCFIARDAAINMAFFTVFDEFCSTTQIWLDRMTLTTVVGQVSYTMSALPGYTNGSTKNRLYLVYDANQRIRNAIMRTDLGVIQLLDTPSVVETLVAVVVLGPADIDPSGGPAMPAWLIGKYNLLFVDGIIAELMLEPGKPYSNPQMAQYHRKRFEAGMAQARIEGWHGEAWNMTRWTFPRGGFPTGLSARQR